MLLFLREYVVFMAHACGVRLSAVSAVISRFSSLKLPFVRRIKSSSASQRSNIIISCIVRHVHMRISASAARATPTITTHGGGARVGVRDLER